MAFKEDTPPSPASLLDKDRFSAPRKGRLLMAFHLPECFEGHSLRELHKIIIITCFSPSMRGGVGAKLRASICCPYVLFQWGLHIFSV